MEATKYNWQVVKVRQYLSVQIKPIGKVSSTISAQLACLLISLHIDGHESFLCMYRLEVQHIQSNGGLKDKNLQFYSWLTTKIPPLTFIMATKIPTQNMKKWLDYLCINVICLKMFGPVSTINSLHPSARIVVISRTIL